MKKSKAQKDILYIAISSFVLVVLWIGFNLYHAHATSTITPELQAQIEEINPTFDTATIQELKAREKVTPAYEISGETASPAASATPGATNPETPAPATQGSPIASPPGAIVQPPGFPDVPEQ